MAVNDPGKTYLCCAVLRCALLRLCYAKVIVTRRLLVVHYRREYNDYAGMVQPARGR